MSKKKRKHRPLSGSLLKMLTSTDLRKKTLVQDATGIFGNENAYEAVKRFIAQGEKEYQEIIDHVESEPPEKRDGLVRSMILKEIAR